MALLLLLLLALPQTVTPAAPMPPDLLFVERSSCTLLHHSIGQTLDAKGKVVKEEEVWRVEPNAYYTDARDRWELPQEEMPGSHEKRPGAIADGIKEGGAALDVCTTWMAKVNAAIVEARKKVPPKRK